MSEIRFSDGIPERECDWNFEHSPEKAKGHKCGECVRCKERDHGYLLEPAGGYHCSMQNYNKLISPEDDACQHYWDRAQYEADKRQRQEDVENRRRELWAIYSERPPIKLPIVFDGFGNIPECPICGEMPYSTEQCHWCGQRFIQDEEIEEYNRPDTEEITCPNCGTVGTAIKSKYNGHRHFHCKKCGCSFME